MSVAAPAVRPVYRADDRRPLCHCASVIEHVDGALLAFWFAGSYETAPDVAILGARLARGADAWSVAEVVVDTPDRSDGQPVPFRHPDGTLWLFFVTILDRDWTSAVIRRQVSRDDGRTWDRPVTVCDREGRMIRGRPVVLDDGAILLPAYDESPFRSMVLRSTDGGASWTAGEAIETPEGNLHPTLLAGPGAEVTAYLRAPGRIWRAISGDGGRSWRSVEPTELPNPNSGIDVTALPDGSLLLAFDDSERLRTPLRLARSTDDGRTWTRIATIESGAAEFSYPALVVDRDRRVHCLYTAGRTEIRELSFPLDALGDLGESGDLGELGDLGVIGDLGEHGAPWEVR